MTATFRTAIFLLKVFPMLHARPVDWMTPRPVVEPFRYRTSDGEAVGDLYRPGKAGVYPGIVVCLGVVPFGVEHPQVPRLGDALARAGFAALLYWSPSMRDFRLDPADVGDIATAYRALVNRPDIDARRSGLLGTCVGGAFALMAASDERIRDQVAFILAYAPYASMRSLARDITSATRQVDGYREPWDVDPLTRKVYLHSVTASLHPEEAERLRHTYAERVPAIESDRLSDDARAVVPLLASSGPEQADAALQQLPSSLQRLLDALSPTTYLRCIQAPLIVVLHDRDDPVIPVGESRSLRDALAALRPVQYTEFTVFTHLDPSRSSASPAALGRELVRFARAIYPVFRRASQTEER